MGLEGIVSKRLGSRCVSGRTRAWLKTKNRDLSSGRWFVDTAARCLYRWLTIHGAQGAGLELGVHPCHCRLRNATLFPKADLHHSSTFTFLGSGCFILEGGDDELMGLPLQSAVKRYAARRGTVQRDKSDRHRIGRLKRYGARCGVRVWHFRGVSLRIGLRICNPPPASCARRGRARRVMP
jgi:hypothetical protein